MKKVLFIILFALVSQLSAQRYMTRNAEVYFLSDKEAVELVEARNTQVGAVIDLTQSKLAFQIQLRAFHFDIALMEEHFNENYVESEVYPKATFRGVFVDLPSELLQQKTIIVSGTMDFHGVQKEMEISVQLQIIEEVLYGESDFVLSCSEFGIEIPKLVSDKIADEIKVTVKAVLTKL
jgi:polyisoprenoid-binding protein YceI